MSFVPPFFGNFGKKVKDLFDKQYKYDNQLVSKNKTRSGLVVESTATFGKSLVGGVEATYSDNSFGETKFTFDTAGKALNNIKLTKVHDGVVVTVDNGVNPSCPKNNQPTTKIVAEYSQANVAAAVTTNYIHSSGDYNIETAVSAGSDGVSVGGSFKFVKDKDGQGVKDYNAGIEYTDKDYTVTLKTESSLNTVKVGFIHKVDADLTVGADAKICRASGARDLVFGSEFAVDKTTTVKSMLKTNGEFAVAYTQKFTNPRVQLGYASKFKTSTGLNATAFGVNATFGDY